MSGVRSLRIGDRGDDVQTLHLLLASAGTAVTTTADTYDKATESAVQEFQVGRGLEPDGICGPQTWAALNEARHRLGDRLLYLQQPMLRGDDVAELQQLLGTLGFDCGRVDGIFGADTAKALDAFQRNSGLTADGIAGPDSIAALRRLGARLDKENVSIVRERATLLSSHRTLADIHVVVGEFGGANPIITTIGRRLRATGARVDTLSHPDPSYHARVANRLGAQLYLAVVLDDDPRCALSYFATQGFESAGGRQLATVMAGELGMQLDHCPEVAGRRTNILRETRMPAVTLRLGPPALVAQRAEQLADAITAALASWCQAPVAV